LSPCIKSLMDVATKSELKNTLSGEKFLQFYSLCPKIVIIYFSPSQLQEINSLSEFDDLFFDGYICIIIISTKLKFKFLKKI
jgi:hypothetical protein